MKIHLDDYLFNMQTWNREVSDQGFEVLEQSLKFMAYCSGHSRNTAPETFDIDQVCKNCLKKYKKHKRN